MDLRDENQQVSLEQVMSPIMQQFREIETCIECSAFKHIQVRWLSNCFYRCYCMYLLELSNPVTATRYCCISNLIFPLRCNIVLTVCAVCTLKAFFVPCNHSMHNDSSMGSSYVVLSFFPLITVTFIFLMYYFQTKKITRI